MISDPWMRKFRTEPTWEGSGRAPGGLEAQPCLSALRGLCRSSRVCLWAGHGAHHWGSSGTVGAEVGGGLSDDCQWSEEAGYHQGDRAVLSLREEPRFCGIWSNMYINTIYIITQGRLHPKDIHQVKTLPLNVNPEDAGGRRPQGGGRGQTPPSHPDTDDILPEGSVPLPWVSRRCPMNKCSGGGAGECGGRRAVILGLETEA